MKHCSRRGFLSKGMMAVAGGAASHTMKTQAQSHAHVAPARPVFVSTWGFGKPANEASMRQYKKNGSLLDAVEAGIRLTEADKSNASVGAGGKPAANGKVQLDACIMFGPGSKAGSVGGIEDIAHPISVARAVMEKTPHVMLVGKGAKAFALDQGFASENLLTAQQRQEWRAWKRSRKKLEVGEKNHDTIALIGIAEDGTLAGGCSTSGLAYKMAGRVGDSPILGSGLYVDNEIGAAGATGVGENVMRFCGSFMVVEYMRQGLSPEEACAETLRRIARLDGRPVDELHINFIALNKKGQFGAAGTGKGFPYAVAYPEFSDVLQSKSLSQKSIGIEGGNAPIEEQQ
ncbi:MAG: N(4)-(beta-N-acetylglucosaminyl)-L-asparaginase [Verrucomicrobiota bacterium]|nr:N(4)-(beta-N-acetylglucosaminyl)-L-asparaginase [Verrucomicrobiota bacterium]MDG1890946.1 N(4)-(beta-N-acetylglucosaminyl)-L-asparaginase [Verrucomicrobiota bacterium]